MHDLRKIIREIDGIKLFESAFPNVLSMDFEPNPPVEDWSWFEKSKNANRVNELPESSYGKRKEIEDIARRKMDMLPRDIDKETTSVEVLAWYSPFAVYGPKLWGIYFDKTKMDEFVAEMVARVWIARPDIWSGQIEQVVWDQVRRHEIEHCVQEISVALAIYDGLLRHGQSPFEFLKFQGVRTEILASHFESVDPVYRRGFGQVNDRRFIESVVSSRVRPGEYNLWDKADVVEEASRIEAIVNDPLVRPTIALRHIQAKIKNPAKAPFLDIPIYLV